MTSLHLAAQFQRIQAVEIKQNLGSAPMAVMAGDERVTHFLGADFFDETAMFDNKYHRAHAQQVAGSSGTQPCSAT
jgi:hypothetical protein